MKRDGPFRKINATPRLADEVYQQILDAIIAGGVDLHKRIVQEKLADQLDVSRTPVREALIRLENEGVLVRDGRSGYKIRAHTDEEALQIYQAREAIEGFSAGIVSRGKSKEIIGKIEDVIREEEDRPKSSVKDYFDANRSIHRSIVESTDNPFLLDMFDAIWNRSSSFYLFSEMASLNIETSLEDHLCLCEAMRQGDEQRAVVAMRDHIHHGLGLQFDAMKINRSTTASLMVERE